MPPTGLERFATGSDAPLRMHKRGPAVPGLFDYGEDSGGSDAMAAVGHFGFQLSLKGLDLTEYGKAAR